MIWREKLEVELEWLSSLTHCAGNGLAKVIGLRRFTG